ncbi:hypothetical protein SCG7109_AF_00140 [Chlamydiales bacterium SCGC AG-110-M15]|nr:hypothetical protein SCG7109_AF_00140 [Chlamydiales bacterium SCGC AG-110-M15]
MPLRITPLEERVVLDAAALTELFFINEHMDDSADSDAYIDASSFDDEAMATPRLLVISSQVPNPEDLINAAQEDTRIVYYDAETTSLQNLSEEIASALGGHKASSIAFINHGSAEGLFHLTNHAVISNETLENDPRMLVFWRHVGSNLVDEGRIDLLACDLAASSEGRELIESLEMISGFDVAASEDLTGNSPYKADWILETDGIDAAITYFDIGLLEAWEGTLAVPLASEPQAGLALGFDGVDDYITVLDSPELNISDHVTIEAWVRILGVDANQQTILAKEGVNTDEINYGLYLNQDGGENYELTLSTDGFDLTTNENLEIGKWYHVAGVISSNGGGTQSLYIDGNLAEESTGVGFGPLSTYVGDLRIAASDGQGFLNGSLDEVRVWNTPRTSTDIADHFDQIVNSSTAGLIGHWRFSQGSGNTAHDYSGNSNHGTLQGSIASDIIQVSDLFDTDTSSWMAFEGSLESQLLHFPQGGSDAGYISTHEFTPSLAINDESNFFIAPAAYLGDMSHLYGSVLAFDLKMSTTANSTGHTHDIVLEGSNQAIAFDISDPGLDWTSYNITLDENSGWVDRDSGAAANVNDVQSVLASLMTLKIRSEYLSDFAITDLDSLTIRKSASASAAWITSTAPTVNAYNTDEDTDLIITLDGFDLDDDALQAVISTLPSSGSLLQFDGTPINTSNRVVSDVNRRVIFRPDPDEFGIPYSSFGFTIDDTASSEEAHISVIVHSINDAPELAVNVGINIDEGGEVILSESHLDTSDDSDGSFTITYTIDTAPANGTLSLSGIPLTSSSTFTQNDIDAGRIKYTHDNSETTSDSFTFLLSDSLSAVSVDTHTYSITINRLNDDAPNPGGNTTVTDVDDSALVLDEDSLTALTANIRLSVPTISDQDGIAPQAIRILNIVGGSISQGDGTSITLGANGSILNLTSGHIDLRFTPDPDRESNATFQYVLVDAEDSSLNSDASSATIQIAGANDDPILSSTGNVSALNYLENAGAVAIDDSIMISDVDDPVMEGATVWIVSNYASDQDLLSFSDTALISSSYDSDNGILILTGQAPLSEYQNALQAVVYMNLSENPSTATRTVNFEVTDGDIYSNVISRDIDVMAVNDDPIAVAPGPGGGLLFDGIDDYVDMGTGIDLSGSDFTLSFWAQRLEPGADSTIISQLGSDLRMGFRADDTFSIYFAGSELKTVGTYTIPEWQHWTATYNATTQDRILYLNGVEVANDTGAIFAGTGSLYAGQDGDGSDHFDGLLDEVRIFKGEILSGQDILDDMAGRLAGDEAGLEAYWRFDERYGYIARDLGPNGHHGQLGGQPQSYQVLASSYFERSVDGWKVSSAGGVSLDPILGDGYVSLMDPDDTWSYWEAPDKYLGDQSSAYGGVLRFSLQDDDSGVTSDLDDVILAGGGITISFNTAELPDTTDRTPYQVALHENVGWKNVATGLDASRSEIQMVLASLTDMKIRAEYHTGDDMFYLDTVMLVATDAPAWIESDAPLDETIRVLEDTDIVINLGAADVDLDDVDARMTLISKLFQVVANNRGDIITNVDPDVDHPLLKVIFGATSAETTSIAFDVTDDGTNFSDDEVIPIEVIAVNNAPVITIPTASPTIFEDQAGFIDGLSISDQDIDETPNAFMSVTLSVDHGTLSLEQVDGLAFSAGATGFDDASMSFEGSLSDVNAAIATLLYISDENYHGDDTLHISVDDKGNTGLGGALTDNKDFLFSVITVNNAPDLDVTQVSDLSALQEDDSSNMGDYISDIIGSSVSDVDDAPVEGIAVVGADDSNGSWEYSLDDGTNWQSLGTVSDSNARLLGSDASTKIRFIPNADYHGSASISIRAWDRSQELILATDLNGELADASTNGGESPYSRQFANVGVVISAINDAPILDPGSVSDLDFIYENLTDPDGNPVSNPGTLVSSILSPGAFSDVDTDLASEGIAKGLAIVTTDETHGTWEYSTDGTNWLSVGAVSDTNALLLASDASTRIRFVPDVDVDGRALITIRAWDQLSGSAGTYTDASLVGSDSPFSVESQDVGITIRDSNDSLVLSEEVFTMNTITEDTLINAGTNIIELFASVSNVDAESVQGIALTSAETTNGSWEFSLNSGSTWSSLVPIDDTNVLLLPSVSDTKIRFVPTQHFNGVVNLTFRSWDLSAGSNGTYVDGTDVANASAFSLDEGTATLDILPINDTPVISAPAIFTVNEDEILSVVGITISDVDLAEAGNPDVIASLTTQFGVMNLDLVAISGLDIDFLQGDGVDDTEIALQGSLADVNAAISGLSYQAGLNYNTNAQGDEVLHITVNDLGSTGSGGVLVGTKDVPIHIDAINDSPHALDLQVDSSASSVASYTLIAELITGDVDLEDVNLHTYTLLEDYGGVYRIEGSQLLIANEALLAFEATPQQEITVRTSDPAGEVLDQVFVISDREVDEEYTLPTDAKLFVNPEIASAASILQRFITIGDTEDSYNILIGDVDPDSEIDPALQAALDALESVLPIDLEGGSSSNFTSLFTSSSDFQNFINSLFA